MNPVIEQLILKKRKEIYKRLDSNKKVRPAVYFIINNKGMDSEIIIPKAEIYFDGPEMKEQFVSFIQAKWDQYSTKSPTMELLAVVLVSDMYIGFKKTEEGLSDEEMYDKHKHTSLSKDPNAIEAIGFWVHTDTAKTFFAYPYKRIGKRVVFIEAELPEEMETSRFGRFANLFPSSNKQNTI